MVRIHSSQEGKHIHSLKLSHWTDVGPQQFQEPQMRGRRPPTFSSYEESLYKRAPSAKASHTNRVYILEQGMGDRENSGDNVSSLRSSKSRRRCRVEQEHPDIEASAPWNAPHVIHPRPGDEAIVVTERFVYRPNKETEEQRRQKEYIDKAYYKSEDNTAQAEEEASRYYHDDWSREETVYVRGEPSRRRQGRYRRDEIYDMQEAEPGSNDYFRAGVYLLVKLCGSRTKPAGRKRCFS